MLVIVASLCIFISMGMQGVFSSVEYINMLWAPFNPLHIQFYAYVNWFLNYFVFYLIIPLVFVCFFYKCSIVSFGFGTGSLGKYLQLYGVLFLIMIPVVILSSQSRDFTITYPLMQVPVVHLIIIWEFLYLVQFIAVEFLFRGFLLFPFCERYGAAGILFSVIPYCIIHLGKPVPEAVGAIVTGIVLGYLAWKSKSIWGGVILHGSIALLMDLLSLVSR